MKQQADLEHGLNNKSQEINHLQVELAKAQ